jgi:hypothetical protein
MSADHRRSGTRLIVSVAGADIHARADFGAAEKNARRRKILIAIAGRAAIH